MSEADDFYAGFVDENGNPTTSIKVNVPVMLTEDQRYWLANRNKILDAIQAEGYMLISNKYHFWLHKASKIEAKKP